MRVTDEKLKLAAALYARKEGEALLAEADEIQRQNVSYPTPRADRIVKNLAAKEKRPGRAKALFGLAAAAACVVITVRLIGGIADVGSDYPSEGSSPAASPPATSAEMLPISFKLPADFSVLSAELDNGMSVYVLESDNYGNVVLTMYEITDDSDSAPGLYEGFDEVIIDGAAVPAKVMDAYILLAFDSGGLRYTVSNADDLGTLAAFYRNIVKV